MDESKRNVIAINYSYFLPLSQLKSSGIFSKEEFLIEFDNRIKSLNTSLMNNNDSLLIAREDFGISITMKKSNDVIKRNFAEYLKTIRNAYVQDMLFGDRPDVEFISSKFTQLGYSNVGLLNDEHIYLRLINIANELMPHLTDIQKKKEILEKVLAVKNIFNDFGLVFGDSNRIYKFIHDASSNEKKARHAVLRTALAHMRFEDFTQMVPNWGNFNSTSFLNGNSTVPAQLKMVLQDKDGMGIGIDVSEKIAFSEKWYHDMEKARAREEKRIREESRREAARKISDKYYDPNTTEGRLQYYMGNTSYLK